jgi:tetratricopeptide (TPR) repeat protein
MSPWLYLAGRHDKATRQLDKCVDLDPHYWICYWLLGQTYEQQGRFSDAIAAEMKILKIEPWENWALTESGRAYALSGHRDDAQRGLAQLVALSKHGHVSKYLLAGIYQRLPTTATLWPNSTVYAERSFFLDSSPIQMDSLRSKPRFQELLRRMNFPP